MDYITIKFKNGGKKVRYGNTYLVEGIVDDNERLITSYESHYNNSKLNKYLYRRVERLRELVLNGDAELVLKFNDDRRYLAYIPVSFFLSPLEYCELTGVDCKGLTIVEHLYNNVMNVGRKLIKNRFEFWKNLGNDTDYHLRSGYSISFISILNSNYRDSLHEYIFRTNKTYLLSPLWLPFTFNKKPVDKKFNVYDALNTYRKLFSPLKGEGFKTSEKTVSFILELVSDNDYIGINLRHYYGVESFKEKW